MSLNHKQHYDWIFLYWMPYNNNLYVFGPEILQMLTNGVRSDNILVVVEYDFPSAKKISRTAIAKGKVESQRLEESNSASEEVFADYLNWAHSRFIAENWAIIILGHGGNLDELSPDDNPEIGISKTEWMNIKKLSDVIENFNEKIGKPVELFFFQNCNKGTIEAHYTLCNTAKYTLSSQVTLGAPNYYYEPLLQFLGDRPKINGGQLAEKIMEFERKHMYHSYTVTNNHHIKQLPAKLNPVIESVLAANIESIDLDRVPKYYYMSDTFVDFIGFLETIVQQADADRQKCNDLIEFVKTSIIYRLLDNGSLLSLRQRNIELSGLGMLLPKNQQHLEKYRYLPVFSDLKLVDLFNAILCKRMRNQEVT